MFDLGNTQKTFIAKTPRVVCQWNKPEQRKVGVAVTTVKTAVAGKAVNGQKRIGRCMVVTDSAYISSLSTVHCWRCAGDSHLLHPGIESAAGTEGTG
jgi:hypothetical protein